MILQILVGFEHSKQFHVFELTRQLPKFAMYAVDDDFHPPRHLTDPVTIDETTSYVSFKMNERYQRLCLWINQVINWVINRLIRNMNEERD